MRIWVESVISEHVLCKVLSFSSATSHSVFVCHVSACLLAIDSWPFICLAFSAMYFSANFSLNEANQRLCFLSSLCVTFVHDTSHTAVGSSTVLRAERLGDRFPERLQEIFTLYENPDPLWGQYALLLHAYCGFFHF